MTQSAQTHLQRLEAMPLPLSCGTPFERWLARETRLGERGAAVAVREYRRYLALVLAAPEGTALMPSPRVAEVWRLHREDTAAYQRFVETEGRLHHHLGRLSPQKALGYRACLGAYATVFGPPPRRWWPAPWLLVLRPWAGFAALLSIYISFLAHEFAPKGIVEDLSMVAAIACLVLILWLPQTVRLLWSPRGSEPGVPPGF